MRANRPKIPRLKRQSRRDYLYPPHPSQHRRVRIIIAACLIIVVASVALQFLIFKSNRTGAPGDNLPAGGLGQPANPSAKPFGMALGGTLDGLSKPQLDSELQDIQSLGAQWIRIDVPWPEVQPTSSTQYNWARIDAVVAAANAHHLKLLGTIGYTPGWAAAKGCDDSTQKCVPASSSQFAGFAATAAKRYSGHGIDAWEIWNEPNNHGFWMPAPNPAAYTQLLKASFEAIKSVDPTATVLSGSLGPVDGAPGSVSPVTFLSDMYAAGAQNFFDVLGYHPYSYPILPSMSASWSGWSMMDSLAPSIRSTMSASGDTAKQIWITEYGAPTNGPGPATTDLNLELVHGTTHVSTKLQAEMLTQSVQQYEQYSWLGNYFWYSYKDLGSNAANPGDFFGLLNHDGSPKPAYSAYKQAASSSQ